MSVRHVHVQVPVGSAVVQTHIVVAHTTEKAWQNARPLRTVALTADPQVQLCFDVPTSLGGLLLGLVGCWHTVVRDRHSRINTHQEVDARHLKGVTWLLPHASSRVTWLVVAVFVDGRERGKVHREPPQREDRLEAF